MKMFTLYVPVNRNDGSPIPCDYVTNLLHRIIPVTGGATVSPVQSGYWMQGTTLYSDQVVTISALGTAAMGKALHAIAGQVATDLGQETVLLTTADATAAFISGHAVAAANAA